MTNTNTASGAADDSLLLCASDLQHSAIYDNHVEMQACIRAVANRIAALASAAAPAEQPDTAYAGMPDDRESFKAYLKECDEYAIVPDVAGAFNAAWQRASRGQASAQQGVQWQCGPQANGFTAPQADSVLEDAARWRMLPAFFEEYQIDALKLYRDIDAYLAAARKQGANHE